MVPADTTTDWIIAIGTLFAAVGTVAAVSFALWQLRKQERRALEARIVAWLNFDEPSVQLTALRITNVGLRTVVLTEVGIVNAEYIPVLVMRDRADGKPMPPDHAKLPVTLTEGQVAYSMWDDRRLAEMQGPDSPGYLYAFWADSLNNRYTAPFPGIEQKRKGWRRRKTYVAPYGRGFRVE